MENTMNSLEILMKQQIKEKHIAHSTKQTIKKVKKFSVIMNFFLDG